MSDENMRTEEHRVSGERLVARVKELIHQGNVRRVMALGAIAPLERDLDLLALQMLGTMLLASLATFIGADRRS
jgi:hypothetical protein